MSKLMLVLFLSVTIIPVASLAQSTGDPLNWKAPIKSEADNIFTMWTQTDGASILTHRQAYRFILNSDSLSVYSRLNSTSDHSNDPTAVASSGQVDVAAGYFVKSVFENVVGACVTASQTIQLLMPQFDSTSNMWSASKVADLPDTVLPVINGLSAEDSRIYIKTGDFLGNGLDQFVLGYIGSDSTIHIQVFSVDSTLSPHLLASINDERVTPTLLLSKFSIAAGDVNGDGKDEIILNGVEPNYNGSGKWAIYTMIYELSNDALTLGAHSIIMIQPAFSIPDPYLSGTMSTGTVQRLNFESTVGHFNDNSDDEIVLGVGLWVQYKEAELLMNLHQYYNYEYDSVYTLKVSPDLDSLTYHLSRIPSGYLLSSTQQAWQPEFCVASGDLNGDGYDEVVIDDGNFLWVDSLDNAMSATKTFATNTESVSILSSGAILSHDFLAIGDLDQDGHADVVVENDISVGGSQFFNLVALSLSNDLSRDSTLVNENFPSAPYTSTPDANAAFHFALVLGNFDGSSFTIGAPQEYTKSNVVQPLVILNAPPVEFDVFNGKWYDLSSCFNGNESSCAFNANFVTSQSSNSTVSTDIHNDFGVGAGVDSKGTIDVDPAGVGISADYEIKVEATLGGNFEKQNSIDTTYSITQSTTTSGDDDIYALVSSYNFWQYPVYQGTDPKPYSYILVAEPTSVNPNWFQSKGYNTNGYIPNHEVGNVLSYAPYDSLHQNPEISQSFLNVGSVQYEVGITGTESWDLTSSSSTTNDASKTWSVGLTSDIDLAAFEVKANYDHSHMSTQSVTVEKSVEVTVNLGSLDSLGEAAGYKIYPYVYHAKNGAFVLNYAVDPILSPPGGVPSWWQVHYGTYPDLTFVLPWFYDPQKGIYLTENIKRYQTADIIFSNNSPTAGDTMSITARVRNFSLVPTSGSVTVKFYVGDPDSGGTIITGTNGIDSVETAGAVNARSWSDATIKWLVPSGLPQYPQIFAVVDPSKQIKEVHESNNMGFAVLGAQPLTGIVQTKTPTVPQSPLLYQSYPNPFNPTAEIEYAVPARSLVTLTVYDILGQKLETLVSGVESAGIHKVAFNGSRYASGVYFYRITVRSLSGNHIAYSKTMKMLELK